MTFPTTDDQSPTVAAITYFYEPFLEAFDPELRDELGVWYTPPEIVRYQVRRVHYLLKTELKITRGLADEQVVVLDPCCGTGAYLLEVARCIAEELRQAGNHTTVGLELKQALTRRIIGFELLTAPFAVAQLQLYILLAELGVPPATEERLSVYLTNALTGWSDNRDVKITFPEMKHEFDASQAVKQDTRVLVVIGNPPYDAFAGVAQAEEAELVSTYKGATLIDKIDRKTGNVVRDRLGFVEKSQRGNGRLYEEFGVKRQLLNDLYVRFFRLAEERIGVVADRGVVSFISNANWLTGRSHPIMRQSLLTNFDEVWIDNPQRRQIQDRQDHSQWAARRWNARRQRVHHRDGPPRNPTRDRDHDPPQARGRRNPPLLRSGGSLPRVLGRGRGQAGGTARKSARGRSARRVRPAHLRGAGAAPCKPVAALCSQF